MNALSYFKIVKFSGDTAVEGTATEGNKSGDEFGLGSSSDHGEQSSINSGGDSAGHLRDSTGEMASEEGHENDSSDNGEPRPLLDTQSQSGQSSNLFLKRSADEDMVNNNNHRRRRQRLDEGDDDASLQDEGEPMDGVDDDDNANKKKDISSNDIEEKQRKKSASDVPNPLGFPTSFLNMNVSIGIPKKTNDGMIKQNITDGFEIRIKQMDPTSSSFIDNTQFTDVTLLINFKRPAILLVKV